MDGIRARRARCAARSRAAWAAPGAGPDRSAPASRESLQASGTRRRRPAGAASGKRRQRADDAVDLRMPSIGCDEHAHRAPRQLCCVNACSQANDDQRQKAAYGRPACCDMDRRRSQLDATNIRSRYFTRVTAAAEIAGFRDFARIIQHTSRDEGFHVSFMKPMRGGSRSFLQQTKVRHRTGTRLSSTSHARNIPSWRFAASPSGSEERSWRIACRTFSGRPDAR